MEHIIKLSDYLMNEYRRLDDIIRNGKYQQGLNAYDIDLNFKATFDEIRAFNAAVEKLITKTDHIINGDLILYKNQQHEYVNDEEENAPLFRDFYTHGLTLEEIAAELKKLSDGKTEERMHDGKFHYARLERIIYRNSIEYQVRSSDMKRETLVEVAFARGAKDDSWVNAIDIEDKRVEKIDYYNDDLTDPYKWISKACYHLNSDTKKKFGINYDLFETQSGKIRLNPKAK